MSAKDDTRSKVGELAALTHATMAALAGAVAVLDDTEAWAEAGVQSCAHWLSFNAGFDRYTSDELVRVGHALCELPRIKEAFSNGQLSFDKVRALTKVCIPADEELWLEMGLNASASQLMRICRAYRRMQEADSPDRADRQRNRRGMWTQWEDDGMLRLQAVLLSEDGALVLAALERVRNSAQPEGAGVGNPALDGHAARRADAFVELCAQSLTEKLENSEHTLPHRMVVHVDLDVLTQMESQGRCHLENGPALSSAVARRIGCDTEVIAITERKGLPIDVGRKRRVVSARLRRALDIRDHTCRFPGCAVPHDVIS